MSKPVVVFMGDSLTEWMPRPQLKNYDLQLAGFSGMGVDFLLQRAPGILKRCPPLMAWVCIGANDVWYFDPQQWEQAFSRLCQTITDSGARLFVSTLMPVENFGFGADLDINNQLAMNNVIKKQAIAHKAILVDSFAKFADNKGYLPPGSTDDGVHLTSATYQQWIPFICQAMNIS